jgi:hypothetical protein
LQISRQYYARYTGILEPNAEHISQFTLCALRYQPYAGYLQLLIDRPQYSTECISAATADTSTIHARYIVSIQANAAHILRFTLCELCSGLYTKYLQLRICMHQYSAVGICAAIVDITSIQCALYCKLGEKYSAHPPVYVMCTAVPAINIVFTAPHI